MKCPYCNDKIALVDWAQHSQECERRKAVREAVRQEAESLGQLGISFPVMAQGHAVKGIPNGTTVTQLTKEEMHKTLEAKNKDELICFLEANDIDHDPSAKKSKLLKLAKGE